MLKHAIALLVSILVTTGSYGSTAPELQIENTVAQCVDMTLGKPVLRAGDYFVDARFLARQELSQCGCTSKVMSYSVEDEHSRITAYRRFTAESDAAKTLKLGRVGKGSQQQKLVMRIGCAGPQ